MEAVPENCQKGIILKLPKESNMMEYTNWCGITLLSVKGKAFFTNLKALPTNASVKNRRAFDMDDHALTKYSPSGTSSNS